MNEGIGDLKNKKVIDAYKKHDVWTLVFEHTQTKLWCVGTPVSIVYHYTKTFNIEFTDRALSGLEKEYE